MSPDSGQMVGRWWADCGQMVGRWVVRLWSDGGQTVARWWPDGGQMVARWWLDGRVGHCVLFRSERSVLFRSFKERNFLFHSFFEFLATHETQKNAKNATFFSKNVKERKERNFLLQRT